MAPKRGKKLGWSRALNEYTKDPIERAILDRLRTLTSTIASIDKRTDLTIKQTNKRQKRIEEKAGLEIKILELTDVSAWDHLSELSRLSSTANPQQTPRSSGETNLMVSVSSMPLASEMLSHRFQATLQISDAQFSIKSEPSMSNPQDHSEKQTNRQEAESQISAALEPSAPSFGYPSKGLQAKLFPNTKAPENRRPLAKHSHAKGRRDQIVPPSSASGGIPEPSATYLSFCNMNPQLSSEPQQLLLVLDLNGTLLFRPNKNKSCSFIERPSTQQFLNYVLEHFSVMIWSSAQLPNVELICEKLVPEHLRQRLIAIWGREQLGLNHMDFLRRVQVYKRLDRIWNCPPIQARHPQAYEGRTWHQGNTVLIDDSKEKSRSEPNNFVRVEEFTGEAENPNILRDLAEYLAILRMQANVSSYIRHQPFNASPTTAYSPYAP